MADENPFIIEVTPPRLPALTDAAGHVRRLSLSSVDDQQKLKDNYNRLKFDVEDAKEHIKRVNAEDHHEMTSFEVRKRFNALERLHYDIIITSRILRSADLALDDQLLVMDLVNNHFDEYWPAIGRYEDLLERHNTYSSRNNPASNPNPADGASKLTVKLPDFKLPDFDGTPESWLKWRETFETMIHNNDGINKVYKYHYLRAAMKFPSGQKSVLDNFSHSQQNYDEAWKALCKRYDDPRKNKAHLFNRLLSVKKMNGETLSELTRIIDEFSSVVTSLELCGASFDDLLMHIVQFRLDDMTSREWQKETKNRENISFKSMMDFLTDQCAVVATLSTNTKRPFTRTDSKQTSAKTFAAGTVATGVSAVCVVCHEQHQLYSCPKFKALTVSERYRVVNQNRLCRNCLSPQHLQRNCSSSYRCRFCKNNHHSMLHNDGLSNNSPQTGTSQQSRPQSQLQYSRPQNLPQPSAPLMELEPFQQPTPPQVSYPPRNNFATSHYHSAEMKTFHVQTESLLATVSILVLDANNQWRPARALMDSGSQGNHVTTSFAKQLGVPLNKSCQTVIGINGQTSMVKHTAEVIFASRYRNFSGKLGCLVSDDITGFLPNRRIDVKQLQLPQDLFLADPKFHEPGRIDMLLGTGVYHDAQLNNVIKRPNMPVLIETEFGWTIAGNFPVTTSSSLICCFTQTPSSGTEELDAKIEKFIELEDLGEKKLLSPEHQYSLRVYNKTTCYNESGEIVVNLPTKLEIRDLESNYGNALRQFFYQEKKRLEDSDFNAAYVSYIQNLIETGRMSEVSPLMKNEGFYLPHHGVKKTSSTTTKVRPVFNASSKSRTGKSLNDCLCVGPNVQPELFEVLLRFREGRFVLKADVEKMYLQVKVNESQRKYQKILWRSSPEDPIRHFTLNTVTFGLAPSSFLATNTLNYAADKFADQFPEASSVIKASFYVDDFVFSFNDLEQGQKLRDQIRYMLMQIKFPMRKWTANHPELLKNLPADHIETDQAGTMILKTLGIVWNSTTDQISFVVKSFEQPPQNKADLLSQIASLFDPKGLVGPVVVYAKMVMKMTRKLKWNEELPEKVREIWEEFRITLTSLNDLRIPRHAVIINPVSIELHGFSDASQEAYGAVFYLRSSDTAGNVQISLLCSKSRVSPPKQQTIARLELCAATLMSKIVMKIIGTLTSKFEKVILWSDSMITLFWIATEPSKLSVFVGNRVNLIQENTARCDWRHISSEEMPADCLSRGMKPDEIQDCCIWWNGPSFLKKPPTEWPETRLKITTDSEELSKEMRKTFVETSTQLLITLIETRFSSLQKLINCFAFIRRFAVNNSNRGNLLSLEEIEAATENIVRIMQKAMFSDEYRYLLRKIEDPNRKEKFPPKSPLLMLTPFMDENRIIRVGGRLQESARLTSQQKHPMILPRCFFSKLVIRHLHKKFLHPGNSAMLSHVRETFWILGAKTTIRQVKHECLVCFRISPKFPTQIMANLPPARVSMDYPFAGTAVDYAGPMDMKTSLTRKFCIIKVYIAVFKCMATGAIHLEAVTALSSAAFIATFDRFVSRRGLPRDIFSDNGTGFVGANNDFQRILKEIEPQIGEFLQEKKIKWHFTTPLAPHAGGIYESGVKSMKHHLVRESANRTFDFEQLTTLLCKIEAILNSRPLTPISDDPDDLEVLTPAHFLVGRPLVAKPERNFIPVNTNCLDRYNKIQQFQQKLWDRWYHEYLHHLQTRPQQFREVNEFLVGDMVLLKDSNLPPMKWNIGRVNKLLPDKHGIVRNVVVKTANGEKQRHVKYLAYLPFNPR